MRVGIREQLGAVVLLVALVPLAVLSISVWINNKNFVVQITSQELSLTASLKASQIASDLLLIQSTCATITTRILLNQALKSYYKGPQTATNFTAALNDVSSALDSGGFSSLLQIIVFSRNSTIGGNGRENASLGLIKATAPNSGIRLPYQYPNLTYAMLGDDSDLGYPAALYPNITYTQTDQPDPMDPSVNATSAMAFNDLPLNNTAELLLGPLQINDSYALVSLTLPITDNLDRRIVLGYMTVVAAATSLISVTQSREGLAKTGVVLLVGPNRRENLFRYEYRPSDASYDADPKTIGDGFVKYVFPPFPFQGQSDRHGKYLKNLSDFGSSNFSLRSYPAALEGFTKHLPNSVNSADSHLTTPNEENRSVAVGWARPQSSLVSWLLIVEQSHEEAWSPIERLRTIVLACVFGTVGLVLVVVLPLAHYSVRPIRRLRDATEKSIAPPGYTPNGSIRTSHEMSGDEIGELEHRDSNSQRSKKGLFVRLKQMRPGSRRKTIVERHEDERRRVVKIPGKVRDRKHFITDELTELTSTFNDMSDELMLQYSSLEKKVAERTEELEISKRAAEAANESKTLFIANISHELKTPLNGILGMCAVCMGEDDLPKIKRSLGIVYKSGDLLLHLLNDLLLFSKNQIGQQLSLEEKEFRLSDVKTQILTIFAKQVQEGHIKFSVKFVGTDAEPGVEPTTGKSLPALGPGGIGRLKDLFLWGDQHRILQVIINLVSNSLKFTPEGGKVEVRIKCLGEAESLSDLSRNSMGGSKQSSHRASRNKHRNDSSSNASQASRKHSSSSQPPLGTALQINPMDSKAPSRIQFRERSRSPPPLNARTLVFQFEVEDTGPGIPDQLKDRVFEPFVQGDLGLSKKYGGTGLGLSICSQLAGLMGGNITLTNIEPHGSMFTMRIPLKHTKSRPPSTSSTDPQGSRPASTYSNTEGTRPMSKTPGDASPKPKFEKDSQPRLVGLSQPFFASTTAHSPPAKDPEGQLAALSKAAAKEPGSKLRVLVAEDNLINIEIVLRMLKLEDIYDVVIAKDGQEAYETVKDRMSKGEFFDLIFMDVQMPNLDGLQSTRLIRQMGYSAPIVALTAFSEESNVKDCYDSGMDMFLSKPIRRPALKQVLKKFATIPEEIETSSVTNKSSTTPSETDVSGSTSKMDEPTKTAADGTPRPP
ncbi:related to protein histidine kinase [Rhynchosporium agropyri]|uniref:histidine kinase n=1 Tax=Rhynchosporium agropyri TaxID=914238 RepID=A0A1E1KKB5_9HELO|nr:related to protein histidine kinase [Rhynchosporium agropyri]